MSVLDFRTSSGICTLIVLASSLWFAVDAVAVDESRIPPKEDRPEQFDPDNDIGVLDLPVGVRQGTDSPGRHPEKHWWLGVVGRYSEIGLLIHNVHPNSPAWRVGLEPSDIIVCVNRHQIGYISGRHYPLDTELQLQADRQGRVRLLVWNHRNKHLTHVHVRLRPTSISRAGEPDYEEPYVGKIRGEVTFQQSDLPKEMETFVRVTVFDGKIGERHPIAEQELTVRGSDEDDGIVTVPFQFDEYIVEPPKGSYTLTAYVIGVEPDDRERKILSSRLHRLKRSATQEVHLKLKPERP